MSSTSPLALNDSYIVEEDSTQNILDIRDNDFILPTNPATYHISSLPAFGTLEVSNQDGDPYITPVLDNPYNGPMVYTPDPDYIGDDSFTYYLINDLAETSNTGIASIYVRSKRPDLPIDWATELLNNGPLNGPSRIDPSIDRQTAGWAWGDKPDYETLNGWMYNISRVLNWAADAIDRIDLDITNIAFTNSQNWTIGENDSTPKTMYAGSRQLLNPYITFKNDPVDGTPRWFASDTGNTETEYPLEHPVGLTEDDVLALIAADNQQQEETGSTSKFFDLRPNGVLTESQAKSVASAQFPNPAQGDLMAVQYTESYNVYYGNGTATKTRTTVDNYIYTSGAWVKI